MKNNIYICPETLEKLQINTDKKKGDEIVNGSFINSFGKTYPISNGIPNFINTKYLQEAQIEQVKFYNINAKNYDEWQKILFTTLQLDEDTVRDKMIENLGLQKNSKILEIGCGTGLDSVNIAKRLSKDATYFLQDISEEVLLVCRDKVQNFEVETEFCLAEGSTLPFPDNYFDFVFSFGGFNSFKDKKKSFTEMSRVVKKGGKVIVGDESMPPWLYQTEFAKVIMNGNPLFRHPLPIEDLPESARDVEIKWIFNGVFYLITYTVGDGAPKGNFDIEIPGHRGGTLNKRFYGQLECVSKEVKEKVLEEAKKENTSISNWLEGALKTYISSKK